MTNELTELLQKAGWQEIETGLFAKGNFTFEFCDDPEFAPGGAYVRLGDTPWIAHSDDVPELVERFDIWLDHPEPIAAALNEHLQPCHVMSQIEHAVKQSKLLIGV